MNWDAETQRRGLPGFANSWKGRKGYERRAVRAVPFGRLRNGIDFPALQAVSRGFGMGVAVNVDVTAVDAASFVFGSVDAAVDHQLRAEGDDRQPPSSPSVRSWATLTILMRRICGSRWRINIFRRVSGQRTQRS